MTEKNEIECNEQQPLETSAPLKETCTAAPRWAKGLSKLQRAILHLALTNGTQGQLGSFVVLRRQVLQEYYRWPSVRVGQRRSSPVFVPEQIGPLRYRAAQVSLSKALKRLVERGLLEHTPLRISLTQAGVEVAQQLELDRNG